MNASLGFTSYLVDSPRMLAVREDAPVSHRSRNPEPEPDRVDSWTVVHRQLVGLGKRRAELEHELCRWLLAAERLEVHTELGMASLFEYADRHLDLTRRQTEERLRVGKALPTLPALDEALCTGTLSFSNVREVSRIATGQTEQAWVDWSAGRRVRDVERAVAARQQGQLPTDPGDPAR